MIGAQRFDGQGRDAIWCDECEEQLAPVHNVQADESVLMFEDVTFGRHGRYSLANHCALKWMIARPRLAELLGSFGPVFSLGTAPIHADSCPEMRLDGAHRICIKTDMWSD